MGDTKLCLLLLLSTYALAQQVDSEGRSPTCLVAKRFQNFRRYVYNYEAETHNGVHGATSLKNGPKVYCKVEIDVVQTCNFIVRTSECSLSEVAAVDSVGSPVYEPSTNAETFQFAMEKNPLKVMVEGETGVKLFPEENEPTTILNIKRGIVSALLVPSLKVEKNMKMATLHGVCDTDNTVNARENVVTDLTLTRDLSRCDRFTAQKDHTSPLALISGMHFPLSKLISSTQTCNYQFSNEESHILSGACTEKHIFLPFSHQNEYGVSTVVKQILTLVESENINDRVFDPIEANLKFLPMETVEEKNPVQTKDSIIATIGELTSLSQTNQGHQRASTFQKLVMQLRGLKAEVMSDAVVHMMDVSGALTWQALAQCGTPECSSTMLQVLRTFDVDAMEVDAAVYALGLIPNPSRLLVKDMLAMAQYKQSKPIMYALSNVVRKLYQAEGKVTPEIIAVSEFMASILGSDCAGEKEMTFLTLRVVGNMGEAMEAADASVKTTLVKCMRQPATTLSVQLAAIQAFRRMSVTNEVRSNLQRVSQYAKGAVQKRLAAYLILMRAPEESDLELVKKVLTQDQNMQVKAFVASHIYNIISSKDPETQKMAKKILDVMGENDVTTDFDYTKSRNYKIETGANYMQTDMRGNMVFDPTSQLPREVMLEMTLNAFGYSMDMWEVGMEGKGFEPTIEALFGAGVNAAAPYFPLNGETKFAVDIQPTGEVTEYTATFSYELLSEGKDGRQKVDSLKMIMKAEGSEPTEATATIKYNRNKNVFTTNVQIPDCDVEAGVRVGLTDSSTKGKSITIEISNKNIPQLSLIGRAKLEAMTDGMLQVQLVVPSLQTDAAVTATLRNGEGLTLEIKSDLKLPETSSVQGVVFKYGEDQIQVQVMSDMNSEIHKLLPYTEDIQKWLILLSEDIMDHKVAKTDMKLRHIYTKALEASSMWLDKITTDVPAFETLKNHIPEIIMPSMPEKLFLKSESTFRYQFNKDRVIIIIIPIPLGGKSSEELRIPALLTTPHLAVPQMGLDLPSKEIQVPTFSVPSNYDLALPLIGMVEVSAKVNSNYYNWEAMISAGNNSVEDPSYMVQYKVMADSPIELLSYTTEGTALITDIPEDTMKAIVNASLSHKLIDTSFGIMESVSVSDNVKATGNYKIQAFSPLGLQTSLDITSQCSLASDIFIGDANMDGSLTVGSLTASTTYSQSFSVEPMKKEARAESTLRVDAPMLEFVNKIKAGYADEQLLIESNTNMNNDPIKHTTKISIGYKEAQLTIQSDSVTKADERMLRSQVDFTATRNEASIRMENQADDTENRVYSLVSASLNPSSLEINADASVNVFASRASHKATLTLNRDSLATSCTTTAQSSPVTFENIIHGGFDTTGASMSINTKGAIQENTAELSVEGKVSTSELYMNSMYKGNLFDANTRNRVNLRMNEDGLTISNSLVASLQDMKTDNKHSMTLTLGSLAVRSKTDNFLSDSNSYKHDITIDIERFTASVVVNNDLKIMDVHFVNEAEFKAEPYNMDLTGSVKGIYSEDELKHTYEISFADMTSTAKCNTNGKLMGSQMSHNTDMELSGLTMKFNSLANFNSPSLRLDSTIHTVAEPFTLNVDAIFNSNSELNFYGLQTGEVYSKFLLKAEPLSFSHSHECRASTTHKLESGTSIETNMDNKFNSLITTKEQSVTFKTTSKLNKHAFDQEIKAYNNPEKLGVEMTGIVSTTVLSKASENQDYSISGFVKYDKNSDSHLLQIPFIEHLPAVIEQVKATIMGVMDNSIELLKDIDTKYEIRVNLQEKVNELKQVIATFDINLFIQDLKNFMNSMVNHMTGLMSKLPLEELKNMIKSVKDTISDFFVEFNVPKTKLEEILSNYEVDKMVESVMDEAVEIMKHLQLREHIQSAIAALKSIDIQPFLNKVMTPVEEFVNQLSTFDFKHMFEDMNVYFSRLIQKIKSFDYKTFTEELKEKITDMSKIPCFGKLHGEFRLISPDYSLRTTAELQNSTTASESPELTVNLNSQATSTFDLIAYTLDATAHVVSRTRQFSLSETIKVAHTSFSFDHEGTVGFYGTSAEASSKTTAKATTEPYKAELVNSAIFTTGHGVSATLETAYNHEVNMPLLEILSETSHTQKTFAFLENGVITLTLGHEGRGKFVIQEYGDEGTQKSDMEITINFHDIKLTFTGETNTNHVQMKQNVQAEFCIYGQINIEASAETKTPFITSSVAELKGEAKVQDMKIEITASHNTELVGNVEGTISNSLTALITPYELMFDIKNKENTKVKLPFKLSGKIDLQNDFAVTLNSGVQQCSWVGRARFNQYKYSHYFTMDNGEKEIHIFAQINGEANLDVLKEPITIPEMSVPFLSVKTSAVKDFSLWEDTGLSMLLTTTQQTFDMESKIVYKKNPDMLTIDLDLQPVVSAINKNTRMLNKNIIIGRDNVVALLTISLDQAKAEYEKYNIELPKTLTVPAYKVPVMNIEVSSFTIPLPDASLITMPALHVPSALSKLTLPKITLPKMQRSIKIPVMGDLTYEFSMKTPVVTLKTNASIINQHEIIVKLDATSTSDFKVLTGKIEGTSTLNRDNGVKLSSVLSVKHMIIDSNHDSTIIFNNEAMDASITNSAKVGMSALTIEANQELFANAQDGLIVSLSSPSSGLLGLQLLTKRPAQVKGRLYSRYPSDPTNDVDIMSIKMSVIDSAMLNIQTTWNMEVPNEMILGLKENIPTIVSTVTLQDIVTNPIGKAYNEITRLASNLEGPLEQIKEEGRVMFKRAADNFEALGLADLTEKVSESMIYVLSEYEEKIQILLNAVIEFLKETQFQLPGFEDKLSGLEVYQKFTSFISEVTEEAITKVPEFVAARSETVHNFITNIQIPIPDFRKEGFVSTITFEELQRILIDLVQTIRNITLEDIVEIVKKSNRFCIQKLEGLNWMSDIYTDFVNSRGLSFINTQVENFRNMAEAYFSDIHTNVQLIFADMSIEQLKADIQSWIGSMVKRLNAFHNMVIEFLKEISKHAESYVRVHDRRIEIDIPIPFSDHAD
ncbi:apolipoprotein B-100-like isoform X3 [Hypomesus transpacificus]|uniref:apolipoprotein B-100-like isoform X3 n=1 Tax=Hypomesus transpacificus TaxID=137520 RepID=UPI001F0871C9|nr:apolipoprotein B-100-like isoform X3 [Hypomesus transpacificus]